MFLVLNESEPHISFFVFMSVLIGRSNIRVTPGLDRDWWDFLFYSESLIGVFFLFWAPSSLLRGESSSRRQSSFLLYKRICKSFEILRVLIYWACLKAVKKRREAISLSCRGNASVHFQCRTHSLTGWDIECKCYLIKINSYVLCVYKRLLKLCFLCYL